MRPSATTERVAISSFGSKTFPKPQESNARQASSVTKPLGNDGTRKLTSACLGMDLVRALHHMVRGSLESIAMQSDIRGEHSVLIPSRMICEALQRVSQVAEVTSAFLLEMLLLVYPRGLLRCSNSDLGFHRVASSAEYSRPLRPLRPLRPEACCSYKTHVRAVVRAVVRGPKWEVAAKSTKRGSRPPTWMPCSAWLARRDEAAQPPSQ